MLADKEQGVNDDIHSFLASKSVRYYSGFCTLIPRASRKRPAVFYGLIIIFASLIVWHMTPTLSLKQSRERKARTHSIIHPTLKGRWLLHDAFFESPVDLILVTTFYDHSNTNFSNVQITINGQEHAHIFEELKDYPPKFPYEPIRLIRYSFFHPVTQHNYITINYANSTYTVSNLDIVGTKESNSLAIATLLRNDEENRSRLPQFLQHYRHHGVTRFEMYVNALGTNSSEAFQELPEAPDITYHNWDFPYWHFYRDQDGKERQVHHAQVPLINMLIKRVLPEVEWLLLGDIDELVFLDSTEKNGQHDTLLKFLKLSLPRKFWRLPVRISQSSPSYPFQELIRNTGLRPSHKTFYIKTQEKPASNKVLYHNTYRGLVNVHAPQEEKGEEPNLDISLAHMVELRHPQRLQEMHGDYGSYFPLHS